MKSYLSGQDDHDTLIEAIEEWALLSSKSVLLKQQSLSSKNLAASNTKERELDEKRIFDPSSVVATEGEKLGQILKEAIAMFHSEVHEWTNRFHRLGT